MMSQLLKLACDAYAAVYSVDDTDVRVSIFRRDSQCAAFSGKQWVAVLSNEHYSDHTGTHPETAEGAIAAAIVQITKAGWSYISTTESELQELRNRLTSLDKRAREMGAV